MKPLPNFEWLVKKWKFQTMEDGDMELGTSSWKSTMFPVAKPAVMKLECEFDNSV